MIKNLYKPPLNISKRFYVKRSQIYINTRFNPINSKLYNFGFWQTKFKNDYAPPFQHNTIGFA